MATLDSLQFEMQRRVVLFKSTTTMPDNSLLGFNGDPNTVSNGITPGQTLMYNSPTGTYYIQDNGTLWYKKEMQNVWVQGGLPDASADGRTYGRKDGAWVEVTDGAGGTLTPGGDFDSPVGTIVQIVHDNDVADWIACNGQELSRATYAALFAITGVRNGEGDGTTTFNAPLIRKGLTLKTQVVPNGETLKGWRGICSNTSDGSVYYTENSGGIYRQNHGSGTVSKITAYADDDYRGLLANADGSLYVCSDNNGVFFAVNDSSPLLPVASLQGKKSWRGLTRDVEDTVWCATNRGGVYKKPTAATDFTLVPEIPHLAFRDIKASPFGIYLCVFNGGIHFLLNGTTELVNLTPDENLKWKALAFDKVNQDMYAITEEGDLYIQTGLIFTFERVNQSLKNIGALDVSPYGIMHAAAFNRKGKIYKAQLYRHIIRYQ